MTTRTLTRIAMISAGIMLAHQVAAKALRDATFLTAWPATALPLMTVATAVLTVALVPVVSRLFERYSTRAVIASRIRRQRRRPRHRVGVLRQRALDRRRHLPAPGRRHRAAPVRILVAHLRNGSIRPARVPHTASIAAAGTAGGIGRHLRG